MMLVRFAAKSTAAVMFVLPSVAHARVNAAIIEYRLHFCEHGETTHCNVLGIYVQERPKCVTHLVKCASGRV